MASSFGQDSESRAFLQRRVAYFGLAGAGLGGFFWLFRVTYSVATGYRHELRSPSLWLHGVAVVAFFILYLVLRRGERSFAFIRRAEETALFAGCSLYSVMGTHIPVLGRPEQIMVAALTYMLVARAIYVPSSASRTVAITGSMLAPLLVATHIAYSKLTPEYIELVEHMFKADITMTSARVSRMVETSAWWVLTTATAGLASYVIFGLRRQVHDARKLGQYTLEHKLGEGGMGIVYRASHAMLRRPTAVKLLPAHKAGASNLVRFEREVQRTAELTHPNTVTIFDYGRTPDGVFYYAMELLDGATVEAVVDHDGPQPASRIVHVLEHVAGALAEAHAVGLIHRDVKPANIVLCKQGGEYDVPKVVDFGLVKEMGSPVESNLTGTETITGTPKYLPPEAITSPERVDARSDLYSLGAVGYFMLTGQHVFEGSTVVEVCSAHMHTPPVPPAERLGAPVNEALAQVILDCLAKAPGDRPQDAATLQRRLRAVDVAPWTVDDAREWWEHRGDELLAKPDASVSATARTIAVDLGLRE